MQKMGKKATLYLKKWSLAMQGAFFIYPTNCKFHAHLSSPDSVSKIELLIL